MYTLYYAPGAASLAVHWMLIELGVPFETIAVNTKAREQDSVAYRALNPSGRVPALIVDGRPYAECTALLMLLAERHPQAGLAPPPGAADRAAYLQWMVYLANNLLPAFRAWFYADEPAGAAHAEAVRAHQRPVIEGVFERMDRTLDEGAPYLLGERLSAVDFLAVMLARWSRNMPKPATAWPHLKIYIDRMRAMPSLREVHAREGLADWIDA